MREGTRKRTREGNEKENERGNEKEKERDGQRKSERAREREREREKQRHIKREKEACMVTGRYTLRRVCALNTVALCVCGKGNRRRNVRVLSVHAVSMAKPAGAGMDRLLACCHAPSIAVEDAAVEVGPATTW